MTILVTAGNTLMPIDAVRCITTVFTGRTGAAIATRAYDRGHAVTLLTSHPEVLDTLPADRPRSTATWRLRTYRTFDDLEAALSDEVRNGGYTAIVHAAAVSDFRVAGVYTRNPDDGRLTDVTTDKISSAHPEVWLRLTPAPKLIDLIRAAWGFTGVLVKFKLEACSDEAELLATAESARVRSAADLMVANTLRGRHEWAWVGAGPDGYRRVTRAELPDAVLDAIEALARQARLPK